MQIIRCEVTPVELKLRQPVRMAGNQEITRVTAIFLRFETRDGRNAWGCCVAHPELTGEQPENAIQACRKGAEMVPDLPPLNLEYSLANLSPSLNASPGAHCAFDLAYYDLLSLAAGLPLYRLLGGYRSRIQTSATVPVASLEDSVELARMRARHGFRLLKIKGGIDPEADVVRVKAIRRALPEHILRLDADGGYTIRQALEVAHALQAHLEMIEQPTPADDLEALRQVTRSSPVPVLADQSARSPESILQIAAQRCASGISIKAAACGGLHCARQADAIARAAQIAVMISCVLEPALLIAAGLSLALSSPNVRFCDLDGNLDIASDPTLPGFRLEDGWLVASDVPGLGCSVNLS
jgi:L-alanine-DL-glutamate epimerase-like enolase superfamily enzyme